MKVSDEFDVDFYVTFLPLSPLGWRGIVSAWVGGQWRHLEPCEHDNSS